MHEEIRKLFDLSGKVALITGGARHLGLDAASVLAAAGCRVALTSREITAAEKTADRLAQTYGTETLPIALDHTDAAHVEEAVSLTISRFGRIDVLVNNAGGGTPGSGTPTLAERDPEDIRELIELNLTGVLYCSRAVGRVMAEQGSGKIISIASIAGLVGRDRRVYEPSRMAPSQVDYAAAKAGVIGMTRDLAGWLSPHGICVNAISPGGFARNLPEQFVADYSDRTPLGRMGRYGVDLKGAVLFLASPASDYVTGHNLVVDGGFSWWK
ncbi:MAG: SDR family oxidoreductase [Pyrinomonadaceae bacterium]|nr:SDR family oxidoreductase [Pyrinomonadaceae bacterium]